MNAIQPRRYQSEGSALESADKKGMEKKGRNGEVVVEGERVG